MDDTPIPSDAPRPRLCYLKKWSDFNGYGFNLHAERGKAGQFVGTIDEGSPAQAADLRAGDRIVEVNGTNIGSENHQQVVQRIKAVPNETKLLVVDAETDAYYRDKKVVVRGDMANIEYNETPDINPYTHPESGLETSVHDMKLASGPANGSLHHIENVEHVQSASYVMEEEPLHTETKHEPAAQTSTVTSAAVSTKSESFHSASSATSSSTASSKPVVVGGLEFAGSAKEARERMKKKGNIKQDPSLTLKDKYDILQKL
jgi:membrane-associated protease RseP (regulator of RpoE activity)